MSLLSIKNLTAPLTNKVHLTSIVLVAFLFAVFRLSGGSVSIDSTKARAVPIKAELAPKKTLGAEPLPEELGNFNPKKEIERLNKLDDETDPLADALKHGDTAKEVNKTQGGKDSTGLDDIEKRLGLK